MGQNTLTLRNESEPVKTPVNKIWKIHWDFKSKFNLLFLLSISFAKAPQTTSDKIIQQEPTSFSHAPLQTWALTQSLKTKALRRRSDSWNGVGIGTIFGEVDLEATNSGVLLRTHSSRWSSFLRLVKIIYSQRWSPPFCSAIAQWSANTLFLTRIRYKKEATTIWWLSSDQTQ
jgi:hypothetical protein